MLTFSCAAKTSAGARAYNEDANFLFAEKNCLLCAVCDGMGGESYGDVASKMAVKLLADYIPSDFPLRLADYSSRACLAIDTKRRELYANVMGTTLVAVSIWNGNAHFFNVGDSRGYLLRGGILTQLTHDHVGPILPPSSSRKLTQYLGVSPDEFIVEPFCAPPIPLQAKDRLLICSDGLTDSVSEIELQQLLSVAGSSEALAALLVSSASQREGADNITALVIQVEEKHAFFYTGRKKI